MPNTPEPLPAPATEHCPQCYATQRQARRAAHWLATKRSEKPVDPAYCADCGGWHTTDPTTTTTGAAQ